MRTGVVIAYNKDGAATILVAGTDIKKQRSMYRVQAQKSKMDEGYERVEWYLTPHKAARCRPVVDIRIADDTPDAADADTAKVGATDSPPPQGD